MGEGKHDTTALITTIHLIICARCLPSCFTILIYQYLIIDVFLITFRFPQIPFPR